MATLLVIGGSGFFGKSILDMFQRGKLSPWNINKVISMSRNAERLESETPNLILGNVELLTSDISTAEHLPDADFIIHAAASTDARNYLNAGEDEQKNIQSGTLNYCRLARGNMNTKTLYVSSGAVYGTQPSNINHIKESYQLIDPYDIPENKRDYTIAKRDAEEQIKELGKEGIKVSIARCFSFVGPFLPLDQHFAIGNFIRDGLLQQKIKVNTKNKVYRSYMYSDDLVVWLMTILDNADNTCPIYNVGSDEPILIDQLARNISKIFELSFDDIKNTNELVERYVPNIEKAKKNLNLSINYSLDHALITTIDRIKYK
jgi:nucleoside-diphosphate-sugar epimerase